MNNTQEIPITDIQPSEPAEKGNISNLYDRKILNNPDGSYSTTSSMSFEEDGKEVLIPTVIDGKRLSKEDAINSYRKTGEHLGKFSSPEEADAYAVNLHKQQAKAQPDPKEIPITEIMNPDEKKNIYLHDINKTVTVPGNLNKDQIQDTIANEYSKQPLAKVPDNMRDSFYEKFSSRVIGGVWAGTENYWRTNLPLDVLVAPAMEQANNWRALAGEPQDDVERGVLDFAEGLGRLIPDMANTIGIGKMVNSQLIKYGMERFIPEAFATGSAVTRWMRSFWEGKGPIEQAKEFGYGLSEGLVYSKIGMPKERATWRAPEGSFPIEGQYATAFETPGLEMKKVSGGGMTAESMPRIIATAFKEEVGETFNQTMIRIGKTIPQMSGAGMAFAITNAMDQGRLATKDEIFQAGANGAAMGLAFALAPAMKTLVELDRGSEYETHLRNIEENINRSDFKGTQKAIDDLINDKKLSQPIRDEFNNIVNKNMIVLPDSGNKVFVDKSPKGHAPDSMTDTVKEFVKERMTEIKRGRKLEEDFRKSLQSAATANAVSDQIQFEKMKFHKDDMEALYYYNEDKSEPITEAQKKIYDEYFQPLISKYQEYMEFLNKNKFYHYDEEISPRFADKPNLGHYDKIKEGGKAFVKNVLRVTGDFMKKRTMYRAVDIDDPTNRRVISINKDLRVDAWDNKVGKYMGKFSEESLQSLFDKETKSVKKKLDRTRAKLSELKKVKVKEPVSASTGERLLNRIEELVGRTEVDKTFGDEAKVAESDKILSAMQDMKDRIQELTDEKKLLSKSKSGREAYEKRILNIDKQIDKLNEEFGQKYEQAPDQQNLFYGWGQELKEVLGEYKDKIEGNEAKYGKDLSKLKDAMDELDTLSNIKSADELSNVKKLIKNLENAMDELDEEHFQISTSYNPYHMQDKVFEDANGKKWKIEQATTREIERHSNVTFNNGGKHLQSNYLTRISEMDKVVRAINWLNTYKKSAEFRQVSVKEGIGTLPVDWKGNKWRKTTLPQFREFYFEPKIADALDFIDTKLRGGKDPLAALNMTNSVLRNAIFFNPLIHVPNIINHWAVNRGVAKWVLPTKTEYKIGWESMMKAYDAVKNLTPEYLKAIEAGGNLQFSNQKLVPLHEQLAKMYGWELAKDKTFLAKVSSELGIDAPMKVARAVKSVYKASAKFTWFMNDFLTMQAVYEEMARGKDLETAIEHVGKHIPNYVVPEKIFNMKWMGKLMTNKNLTMFGAYHYGAFKSYGEMIKSLVAPVDKKDRLEAFDKLLALGVWAYGVYPMLDKVAQAMLGDKRYHLRRAGASTFFDNVKKLIKGQIGIENIIPTIFTPAIGSYNLLELALNRNFFTGDEVRHQGTQFEDTFKFAMESVAPLAGAQRIAEGKVTWYDYLLSMASISKTDPNVSKMYRMGNAKKNMQRVVNNLAKTDEQAAIEKASEFNISQADALAQVGKEAGIEGVPDKAVLNRYFVNVGKSEEEYDMKDIQSFFKKPARKKNIYRGISEEEIKKRLDEGFNQ